MKKVFIFLTVLVIFSHKNFAQNPETSLSKNDSLQMMQDLMNLLDSAARPTSYAFVNIGIGNRLFSLSNNSLNAKQSTTNTVIYSPSVGYFHKSGLSISAGANLLSDGNGFGASQYFLTPAFYLAGNKFFDMGISYTHFFVKDKYSSFSSPVQNDFFASFKYKKTWLQPGISFGYSTGEYKEALHRDTIINGTLRRRYDSITYKLNAFSMIASVGHKFLWFGVLDKLDGVAFTPTLMANAGSGKTTITHKSNVALINYFIRKGKLPKLQTDKFEMQSVGLNLDLNYTIGNFTFEPQLYLDYYLPITDSKRFTQVFVFNIGYAL